MVRRDDAETWELPRKGVGAPLDPGQGGSALCVIHEQLESTYFEKADAPVAGGRCEVFVIIKVNITQAPGMCKLLPTPIKNPRTAQVPAWRGRGRRSR